MAQLPRLAIAPAQLQAGKISLTTPQQHYLSRVMRLQAGDRFMAIDGQGKCWLAAVNGVEAEVLASISLSTELPVAIMLMLALPKGNTFDDVVRCCTELGVAKIMPVISDRTLLQPSPQKLARWQRIATEAAEQSERTVVPQISAPVSLAAGLATVKIKHRYFCVARRGYPHLRHSFPVNAAEVLIAIGPEGGWSPAEVEQAIAAEFQPVSLGNRILRAATAPIVAMSLAAAAYEL